MAERASFGAILQCALERARRGLVVALFVLLRGDRAERLAPPEDADLLRETLDERRLRIGGDGRVRLHDGLVVVGVPLRGLDESAYAARSVAHRRGDAADEPKERHADVRVRLLARCDDSSEALRGVVRVRELVGELRQPDVLVDVGVGVERSFDRAPGPRRVREEIDGHLGERDGDARAVRPLELLRE